MVQPLDLQIFARVEQIAGNLQLEQVRRTGLENTLSNRLDTTSALLDARVDGVEHDLQQERGARTQFENALSNRFDGVNAELNQEAARLDGRVDSVAGDLQRERDERIALAARLDGRVDSVAGDLQRERDERIALAARLDDIRAELDGQLAAIRHEIEQLEHEIEELEDLNAYFEYCALANRSPFRELLQRIGITTVEQLREREPGELHREMSGVAEQEPHYRAVPAVRRRRVTDEIIRWSRQSRAPSGDAGRPAPSPRR
jgi:chromosome segregation ATPase